MLKRIFPKILCFVFGAVVGFLIVKIGPTYDPRGRFLASIITKENGAFLTQLLGSPKLSDSVFIGAYHLLAFAPTLIVAGIIIGVACTKIKNKRLLAYSVLTWPALLTLAGSFQIRSIAAPGSKMDLAVGQYFSNYFGDNTFKLFIIFVSFYIYMTISFVIFNKFKAGPNHRINADGK